MRHIFNKFIFSVVLVLATLITAKGNAQINPNQINWPLATGAGAPGGSCSSLNYGQPYTDTTNNNQYVCTTSGWVKLNGSGGPPSGSAGGDLGGSYPNPTVGKVNGAVVPASQACVGTNGSSQIIGATCGGGGGGGVVVKTTSYTAVTGDSGENIVFNAASAPTLTLPATPPSSTWYIDTQDVGVVAETINPNGLTLDGITGNAQLNPNMGVRISTDGTNYFTQRGGILTPDTAAAGVLAQSLTEYDCGAMAGDCGAITLTNDVSPGSALIIDLFHSNGGSVTTPTDGQGDIFTLTNTQTVALGYDMYQYVACGAVGGPTTITESDNTFNVIAAYEVTGIRASSCIDVYNSAGTTSGSSLSTGSITTTANNDFILVTGGVRQWPSGSSTTMTEGNSYTVVENPPHIDIALNYETWRGVQATTATISDTITYSASGQSYFAGIVALKPLAAATAFTEGSVPVAGPTGALQPLAAGPNGYVLKSNGPGTMPSYQASVVGTQVKQNSGANETALPVTGFMPQLCADSSGSGTAQSCTVANTFVPQTGNCVVYSTTTANSGTGLTVNVNSLGAKSVAIQGASGWTTTLVALSSIPANKPMHICYDGTNWNASGTGFTPSGGGGGGAWINLTSSVTVSGCTVSNGSCAISGGSTAAITFSVIPQTYNAIQIRSWGASSSLVSLLMNFNSDSTNNYIGQGYISYGTTLVGTPSSSPPIGYCSLGDFGPGVANEVISDILFYANTSFGKIAATTNEAFNTISNAPSNYDQRLGCAWNSTAAITSITIALPSGHFSAGTQFEILGQN